MEQPFFSIKELSYVYENTQQEVLKELALSVEKGEIVGVLGTSGVGKTTLFHLISGLLPLQKGEILLQGQVVQVGDVSYMLQKDLLLPHKTVLDNVVLPHILRGVSEEGAYAEATQKLQSFGLEQVKEQYPHQLSGGMRQRVALLRTYMWGKPFLLLDEPFSALDALTKKEMEDFYLEMHRKLGWTALLITHDVEEVLSMADKVVVLSGKPGRVVLEQVLEFSEQEEEAELQRLAYKKKLLQALEQ